LILLPYFHITIKTGSIIRNRSSSNNNISRGSSSDSDSDSSSVRPYPPSELLQHLVKTVIPLQKVLTVPDIAPIHLPTRAHSGLSIGTTSLALKSLNKSILSEKEIIHLEAMKKRDALEDGGFGDQLEEMQETSWPLDRIRKGGFKIDMCFSYTEEGQSLLQWCQGVVTVKKDKTEKYNYLDVEVKWNEEFVESGCKVTRQKLKKIGMEPVKTLQ
jgi:hypothetical protein